MLYSKKNGIGLKFLLPLFNELWEIEKPHRWALAWACRNCLLSDINYI